MANTSITDTFNAELSATLAMRMKQLWDQLSKGLLLFRWMDASRTKRTGYHTHRVEFPVLYGSNDTVGRRAAYDTIPLTPQEGITIGYVTWGDICGSVVISDEEVDKNGGKQMVFDLLDAKTEQLRISLEQQLSSDLHGDGTASNQINGLDYWFTTSTGTVAGINDATNTWWQNQSETSVGSFASNGRDKLRSLYNDCSSGMNTQTPTHVLTTDTIYEAFEKTMDSAERLAVTSSAPGKIDVGPKKMSYKGMEVGWDSDCSSGTMYMLNLRNRQLQWNILADNDFKSTPFVRPANQRAKAALWSIKGNLVCTIRKRFGKMTGLTA